MSINKQIWDTEENAEAYDSYAINFPMYKEPKMTVVDLAAGTGVTTQAIIDSTNGDVHIIDVDQADKMLKKAEEKFPGKAIDFIVSEAETVDEVIKEPIDVIVCNSAFWQIKPKLVFKAVSKILKDGGVFAFNLPDHIFLYEEFRTQPKNPSPYNIDDLTSWAKEEGLSLVSKSVKSYEKSLDEIIAFSTIPVMKRNFKTEEDQKLHIERLRNESAQKPLNQRQWLYLVFKKG
jgi:ubiquinone/menaquinone biosynthesis C-methylase UbiE